MSCAARGSNAGLPPSARQLWDLLLMCNRPRLAAWNQSSSTTPSLSPPGCSDQDPPRPFSTYCVKRHNLVQPAWPQTGTRRAICRDVLQHASHETTDGERLMTVAQVADRLQVHRESVRRWIRQGRLRGSLVGGDRSGYRIDAREVRRFVAEGVPDAVRAASSRQ
jgi:excisionase family DNA binding protein